MTTRNTSKLCYIPGCKRKPKIRVYFNFEFIGLDKSANDSHVYCEQCATDMLRKNPTTTSLSRIRENSKETKLWLLSDSERSELEFATEAQKGD